MNSIKNVWAKVVTVLSLIIGILLYFLQMRGKKVAELRTKLDLADTQKKADLLETEIKNHVSNSNLLQKEIDEHNKTLQQLEEKRKNIPDDHDATNYWSNN